MNVHQGYDIADRTIELRPIQKDALRRDNPLNLLVREGEFWTPQREE